MEMIGNPLATVISFKSTDPTVDTYKVAEAMSKLGWSIGSLQFPRA